MKKKIVSVFLAIVMLVTIIMPLSTISVSAASYPTVWHKSMGMKVYCGDTVPLVFSYHPAYNYERITVNIYSPSGDLKGNSKFDINNKYTNYGDLTVILDTKDYEPGKYQIEIIKEFYSFYSWHTAPTNGSSSVTLVKPSSTISLKNEYTGTETHFEKRNDATVLTATNSGINHAYNAWQKIKVKNVSQPYEIQMTEMYIGDEAENIAIEENMFNAKNNSSCQWVLTKFEIKNTGSSTLEASDTINWTKVYLPTGEEATLIDTCTFGDLPDYATQINPGETKEAWFGFYVMKYQGIPFLKLENGAYISTHPSCSKGHRYTATTTKATLSKNGSIGKKCAVCGKIESKTTVYYPKTFKLSTTSYTYSGSTKKPTVTVKDASGKTLKNGTDYTVSYKNNKNVGTATVTVTFKGNYSGTKSLNFTIKPKTTTLSKLTAGSKQLKVTWKKNSSVSGYQIQYSTSKKFTSPKTVTVKGYKTTSKTLKSLKAKKTYYVRIRTYKTVNGKKVYSDWSAKALSKKTK